MNKLTIAIFAIALSSAAMASEVATSSSLFPSKDTSTVAYRAPCKQRDSNKNLARELSRAFTSVAKTATPAVVFIQAESNGDVLDRYPGQDYQDPFEMFQEDFFNRFFGPNPNGPRHRRQPQIRRSQGSGFLISKDGYLMTNYHVVHDATKILVNLNPPLEKQVEATFIGGDPRTDIALLKIEGDNYPYLEFGNSDDVEVGEWAIAVGSPFQLEATVTVGVISAKGRNNLQITDIEDFIQTDAAINPGNSGGPLLNLDSQVIGMNTAILSPSGGYMGIGFAIPSSILQNVEHQLSANGEVSRGFLGVSIQPIDQELAEALQIDKPEGVLVAQVQKNSPADKAGLRQGDIIVELNGSPVKSIDAFRNQIMLMPPNTRVILKVNRQGKMLTIPVIVGKHEHDKVAMTQTSKKLGLEVQDINPELASQYGYREEQGVVVTSVKNGSIAQRAGIKKGWLIIAVNHKKVINVHEFNEAIESSDGSRVLILINVKGSMRFFSLKVPN